jgi:hypothetical protein
VILGLLCSNASTSLPRAMTAFWPDPGGICFKSAGRGPRWDSTGTSHGARCGAPRKSAPSRLRGRGLSDPRGLGALKNAVLASLAGCLSYWGGVRWYRSCVAQPPANRCDAYGIGHVTSTTRGNLRENGIPWGCEGCGRSEGPFYKGFIQVHFTHSATTLEHSLSD